MPNETLLSAEDKEKLQKLAGYIAAGVAAGVAGTGVGISASRVSQLLQEGNTEPAAQMFQQALREAHAETAARMSNTATTTQEIIAKALENVKTSLQFNGDPDFSLKVLATVAKLPNGNGSLLPQNHPVNARQGDRVVLKLTQNFALRAEAGSVRLNREVVNNKTDFLNPTDVEQLMQTGLAGGVDAARNAFDSFAGVPVMPAADTDRSPVASSSPMHDLVPRFTVERSVPYKDQSDE